MNRRQKIIVSITGIFIILLALVGLTYAYFLTKITPNSNDKSISVTTANLELVYGGDDGSIIGNNEIIEPGKTFKTKTFTVTNNGNATIDNYAVILEDVKTSYATDVKVDENTTITAGTTVSFARPEDFEISITCSSKKKGTTETTSCNGMKGTLPLMQSETLDETYITNGILVTNNIEEGEVQTYSVVLEYVEANKDQSADMNKRLEGKFNIIDANNTVDIEGKVTGYTTGDSIVTNSIKRESQINSDGTYKIVGLEADNHSIVTNSIKRESQINSDGSYKIVGLEADNHSIKLNGETEISKLSIVKGETASVNNTTITITDASRTATIDLNASSKSITIDETIKSSLKESIIANAKENKNGTKLLTVADTPVAEGTSTYKGNVVATEYYPLFGWDGLTFGATAEEANNGNNAITGDTAIDKCESVKNQYISDSSLCYSYCNLIGKVADCTADGVPILENLYIDEQESSLVVEQDDMGISYYYRGNVEDNYVTFADMCWRIVRINGDGTTKLILEDQDQPCSTSINGNWGIPTATGGSTYTGNFGYTYYNKNTLTASDGTQNKEGKYIMDYLHGQTNSASSMPTAFKNFQSTFTETELLKLKSGNWCLGDAGYSRTGSSKFDYTYTLLNETQMSDNKIKATSQYTFYYYDSYVRLSGQNKDGFKPTLKCNGTIMNDWDDDSINPTPMYVGTLTADEIIYAGASWTRSNSKFYLINDSFKNKIFNYDYFWSLSPITFTNGKIDNVFVLNYVGSWGSRSVYEENMNNNWYAAFRPAVSLASSAMITGGDGTIDKPYVIN